MKDNPLVYTNHKHDTKSQILKTILKPDIVVDLEIPELDTIFDGFKAGEMTYIDGNSKFISNIPNQLCVNTYRTFNSDTLYIDGGICADPYKIARYARNMEVDQNEVLNHVQISRAFTVYQLSTFIETILEKEIERYEPRTLIVGKFPALYLDPDVSKKESQIILENNLTKLRQITSDYNLITVLTNVDSRLYSNQIRKIIQSYVNETIQMKYVAPCTYVDLVNRQKGATILDMAKGQLRLEHFGMVM